MSSARTRPPQAARGSGRAGNRGIWPRIKASASATSIMDYVAFLLVESGIRAAIPAVAPRTILIREEARMARIVLCGIAGCLVWGPVAGQRPEIPELTQEQADSRTVLGVANEYLAAGAEAIRAGQYDDGIRLTKLGLNRPASPRDRAAALSNLCAAHAAKREPDTAIGYCTESLDINDAK